MLSQPRLRFEGRVRGHLTLQFLPAPGNNFLIATLFFYSAKKGKFLNSLWLLAGLPNGVEDAPASAEMKQRLPITSVTFRLLCRILGA
jgi:hypothetical protein